MIHKRGYGLPLTTRGPSGRESLFPTLCGSMVPIADLSYLLKPDCLGCLSYTPAYRVDQSGASISDDGVYRYELWRRWDETLNFVKFIMLNPSTADAKLDDPTIRKCMKFARTWGYGGIWVVNLFAYRATDPKKLKGLGYAEAVGPGNNAAIIAALGKPGPNIAAWGQGGKIWSRGMIVREDIIRPQGRPLLALKLSQDGTPWHPLYLRDNSVPLEMP